MVLHKPRTCISHELTSCSRCIPLRPPMSQPGGLLLASGTGSLAVSLATLCTCCSPRGRRGVR